MKTTICPICERFVLANDDNSPAPHTNPSGWTCTGSVSVVVSLHKWCIDQMISAPDRQAFKMWLGDMANIRMHEASWLNWFAEWVRSRK